MPHNLSLRRYEYSLLITILVLKVYLLIHQWGIMQGYDASTFIEVVTLFKFGDPFPHIYQCFNCFHPPLSFLLTKIISLAFGDLVTSSQLLSFLAISSSFLFLRSTLKYIGLLYSIPGIVFLYLAGSLPLFIFLSTASTYESAAYFFSILTLYLSVLLYWNPPEKKFSQKRFITACLLCFSLVGGLETKYTGVLYLSIPFIVVFVRNRSALRRVGTELIVICLLTALLVSPIYLIRNYIKENEFFPINMTQAAQEELVQDRTKRDADLPGFFTHVLRIPHNFFHERTSPIKDSLFHTVWLQTWIRQENLDKQGPQISVAISNLYFFFFLLPLVGGSALFSLCSHRKRDVLDDIGKILLGIGIILFLALLVFAYKFPLWKYGVIKAKYIAPALLWIPFASAYCIHSALQWKQLARYRPYIVYGSLGFVMLFVLLNHIVPVY